LHEGKKDFVSFVVQWLFCVAGLTDPANRGVKSSASQDACCKSIRIC